MNKLKVLYEDNHIIVAVKPYNVLSQGDITNDISMVDLVKKYIKEKYNKPGNVYLGLVHRLDRPVGGIMVFARTSKAASRLSKMFLNHEVEKKYYAIVAGRLEKNNDTWIDYIARGKDGKSYIDKNGKKAVLKYKVIDFNKQFNCSLVSITLLSGRHHQIRVQFSARGHYLLGDQRYGVEDHVQISLFAYYLSFLHPVTHERMTFKCLPKMENYWTRFTL